MDGYRVTQDAVRRQLAAFGTAQYWLGLHHVPTDRMAGSPRRVWKAEELLHSLRWLRYLNVRDHDIWIQPADDHAWVLVDDLDRYALAMLDADGLAPGLIVETSPNNFQAWLRLSPDPVAPADRRAAARRVALQYGGDPGSADALHFGRLVGFTNRKRSRRMANGQYPWVRLRRSHGDVAPAGAALLERAAAEVSIYGDRVPAIAADELWSLPGLHLQDPAAAYAGVAATLLPPRPGEDTSLSGQDYRVARSLARQGVSPVDIAEAIRRGSPGLGVSRHKDVKDYLARTVSRALNVGLTG